ncbi:T9SS type A sorting domain-containing protein [Fluviicola sp.]|uniref:T9SS type A sorting domain-containing protein n=1 Tax=Fluviicola sp. TaxID=1917219 RepID=UPI0026151293|nr:T9SS type A sorting domain-containing protein [Fluviicola sp.]
MNRLNLSSVSVYPNPTDGNLTISGDELFTELVLTDVSGKIPDRTSLYPSGMVSYPIHQPEGVYFLKITAGKSTVVKKILVR